MSASAPRPWLNTDYVSTDWTMFFRYWLLILSPCAFMQLFKFHGLYAAHTCDIIDAQCTLNVKQQSSQWECDERHLAALKNTQRKTQIHKKRRQSPEVTWTQLKSSFTNKARPSSSSSSCSSTILIFFTASARLHTDVVDWCICCEFVQDRVTGFSNAH